jgi:rubrerythrin
MKSWNTIEDVLNFAIREEQLAADFYARLSEQSRIPGMKDVLIEFAAEELKHKFTLEEIVDGARFSFASQRIADLKIAEYLPDVVPDPRMSYRDVLVVAMKKEKAACRLYSDLAEAAGDDALRTVFLALAQEEAKHKLRFECEYDDLLVDN